MKLNQLTLLKALELLKAKKISLVDIYRDIERSISEKNKELNIFPAEYGLNNLEKEPLKLAERLTGLPLGGLPIAVKDNFLTKRLETTASSKVLKGFMSPYESTVTDRLQKAGGVVVGKTNMDAWAHGSSTETSDWQATKNPRNLKHLPGGSSGGSAAAVASDMCLAAIGSETAGSIRLPAAWCGVVGLKPTYGRVSRYGVISMGSSLDSPGPMGKTVADCAFILEQIAGKDPFDATTGLTPVAKYSGGLDKGVKGLRIGICYMDFPGFSDLPVSRAVRDAGHVYESLGANVEEVPLSDSLQSAHILSPNIAIAVYTIVQRSEVSSNLARYDGVRFGQYRSEFGDEAKRRIMLGTFTLSKGYADKYYNWAQKIRGMYIENFTQLFTKYDLLISSPSPGTALPIGSSSASPMFGELQDMLVEPSSLAGLPGISLPCWTDQVTNLPLGLNIMAAPWQEEKMLQAAHAYERATSWNSWLDLEKKL